MVSAVIGAFLYLRIIVAMFMSGADDGDDGPVPSRASRIPIPAGAALTIAICLAVTVFYGLVPGALVSSTRVGQPVLVQSQPPAIGAPAAPPRGEGSPSLMASTTTSFHPPDHRPRPRGRAANARSATGAGEDFLPCPAVH